MKSFKTVLYTSLVLISVPSLAMQETASDSWSQPVYKYKITIDKDTRSKAYVEYAYALASCNKSEDYSSNLGRGSEASSIQ